MTAGYNFDRRIALALRGRDDAHPHQRHARHGTSSGINIQPGSDDDGWIVPPPVCLADGTRLQLYKDGEALHAAYEAVKAARRRICLEVYIFAPDETGWAFAELLCAKARQGVRVYVIYDAFGSMKSAPLMHRMRRAGVNLQAFHPIKPWECHYSWRPVLRDHRKVLIIDDHIAGLGGLNIGAEYAGSWVVDTGREVAEVWRDSAVGIVGPAAAVLLESFKKMWYYLTHGGRIGRAELIHNIDNDCPVGVLASVPTLSSPLAPLLRGLFRSASRSIHITMGYFAPADDMIEELCRAVRRGARVRLMLAGQSDLPLLAIAARAFYERLLSEGIEIYERRAAILHAKTVTIDGALSVIGSANLDYRSFEANCELSLLMRSPEFAGQMDALFEHDVVFADQILLENWRRRPHWDRVVQALVKRTRTLL